MEQYLTDVAVFFDDKEMDVWYSVAGNSINHGLYAMANMVKLTDPVSGSELNNALEPFKLITKDLSKYLYQGSEDLVEASKLFHDVFSHDVKNHSWDVSLDDIPEVPSDPMFEWISTMKEYVESERRHFTEYQKMLLKMASLMPAQHQMLVDQLKSSFEQDIKLIELGRLDYIERKYRIIDASLTTGPVLGGYLLDKVLQAYGIFSPATEIGIAISAIDSYLLRNKIEENKESELNAYRKVLQLCLE